jgi:DNA-binding transcriptional ArsR family regulator
MKSKLATLLAQVVALQAELASVAQARAWAQKEEATAEDETQLDKALAAEASVQVFQLENQLKRELEMAQAAALSTFGIRARSAMKPQLATLLAQVVSLQAELASVAQARALAQKEEAAAEAETHLDEALAAEASVQVFQLENQLKRELEMAQESALSTFGVRARSAMKPQLATLQAHVVSLKAELASVAQARAWAQKEEAAAEAETQLDKALAAEASSQILQLHEELKRELEMAQAAALSTFGVLTRSAIEPQSTALQAQVISIQGELASVAQAKAWAQKDVAAAEAGTQLDRARAAEASLQILRLENELKVAQAAVLSTIGVTARTATESQLYPS